MGICFVCADGQAGIEEENAALSPGREETAVVGGRCECRVVPREGFVDVLEGQGCDSWGLDGEGEAVGLVVVMVGVLAEDYGFDCIEGGVAGPVETQLRLVFAASKDFDRW
jgi:hypothetical protein